MKTIQSMPSLKLRTSRMLHLVFLFSLLISGKLAIAQCAAPTSTIVNNTNCTTPNGRITFTAPTPTANYLFSIDGGLTFGTPGQTVFNGLFGGDYPTVSKNIASGCVSATVVKTLTNPANPVAPTSTILNNTNCNTPNGRITFTAPAPTANYQFSIDGGVSFGTPGQTVFNGLSGGTYATVVRSLTTNCTSAAAVKTITNPTVTAPTSTVVNVTNCNTPNGSITFTAPTPLANYQFSIDGGATFNPAGVTSFTGLTAGTYSTKAKLVSTGCISAGVNKVVANPTVTAPASTVTNVTNCNTPNGRIAFTAPTPVANYQFSIDGGLTFGTPGQTVFTGLAAGTYSTRAKLVSTGCVSGLVSKVVANPAVTAPTSTFVNPTNCNTPNGSITFSAPTPLASYQFSVNNGASFGTPGQVTFTGLAAGVHTTRAKLVSSGCISGAVNKTLVNPTVAAPTSTTTTSSCSTPTGSITFTAPTPTANYQFSVNGGATFGTPGQTVFTGLAAGTHVTRAKLVSSGCVSAAANKTITNTVVTAPTSTIVNLTNCNTPNGSITFTAPTPTANYQFSIDGGATFGPAGTTVFSGLEDGTYSTVAKLVSSGCQSAIVNRTITKPTVTAPTSTIANVTNCAAPNGSLTFTAPTPTANYQFSIDGGLNFGAAGTTVFSNLSHGIYPTVAKLVSSGCMSAIVNRTVNAPVLAGADKAICQDQFVTMTANTAAGASWIEQSGNPVATTITTPASATTTVTGFTIPGTYNFIWRTASCADTVSVEVADCASPLPCVNQGYLFQSISGSGTDFISVNLKTGVNTILYTDITTSPAGINAIGYNVTDNHIWGSALNIAPYNVARVGANGVPVYFDVAGLPASGFNVGTVDDNGILYLYLTSATDIYRVDVNPASPTYLNLLAPVLNTTAMTIADWAYNPVDNMLYGINTNSAAPIHQLVRINPNTGVSTIVGTVTSSHAAFNAGSFGAAYLDANGHLYVSDNSAGGIYKLPVVHSIFGNTTASLFSQGAVSNGNDGCLCHYACVKPEAGRDTTICSTGIATMSADGVTGIKWIEDANNPGTSTISDDADGNTTIYGFSAPGTYNYFWNNGGLCNDTASITVYNCVRDTVTAETSCDTLTIAATPGSIAPSPSTVYATCGLDPDEAALGALTVDENGNAVWTPNATVQDTITSCLTTCNGTICDTTFIVITPCASVPLPVTLMSFRGSTFNCTAAFNWTTSAEWNVSHFELQKSTNGSAYTPVAQLPPKGSNSSYTYTDASMSTGRSLYRLRIVDIDGQESYSRVIQLSPDCNAPFVIKAYPNPVDDKLTVSGLSSPSRLSLIDATGRTVVNMLTTNTVSEIDMRNLASGVYTLQVVQDGKVVKSIKVMRK